MKVENSASLKFPERCQRFGLLGLAGPDYSTACSLFFKHVSKFSDLGRGSKSEHDTGAWREASLNRKEAVKILTPSPMVKASPLDDAAMGLQPVARGISS